MIELQDEKRVSVRMRLPTHDMFWFKEKLEDLPLFREFIRPEWEDSRLRDFLVKALTSRFMADDWRTPMKALMVVNVVDWHMKKEGCAGAVLLLRRRAWSQLFIEYAAPLCIQVQFAPFDLLLAGLFKSNFDSFLKTVVLRFPLPLILYKRIRALRHRLRVLSKEKVEYNGSEPVISVFGRGHMHFENDGLNSDAFFCFQSDLPFKNVVFPTSLISQDNVDKIIARGSQVISFGNLERLDLPTFWGLQEKSPVLPGPKLKNWKALPEFSAINSSVTQYNLTKAQFRTFFSNYNARINLGWFRYYEHHIAVADALEELGGISVMWQLALDVLPWIEMSTFTDVFFGFSNRGIEVENRNGSRIPYYIVTGFPKDHLPGLLKQQAACLREQMVKRGAKKIIAVFDEGSVAEDRWNYGYELARQNYQCVLEKVIEIPWVGAVFKPKNPHTLRRRLGSVNELLDEALATGRCHVYGDQSGDGATLVPPVLAALSADVAVHGHLSAGTSAFESALAGVPSLLVDREGWRWSKLYELGEGNVVFSDWPSCLEGIFDYWKAPQEHGDFGNWSPLMDELDPFQDGRGAERMGNYLHHLIEGFNKGHKREFILENAAEEYAARWGHDKILSIK